MQVLIVKTSSMGDIIHTLPALTDAMIAIPEIKFDWLIEPGFAEIPHWHKAVQDVIVVPLRDCRKQWLQSWKRREIQQLFTRLRIKKYDVIIDAQGLLKSSILARVSKGKVYGGFAANAAREPIASIFYNTKISVSRELHAIERIRRLFAGILQYSITTTEIDYGVRWDNFISEKPVKPYLFFLHGTTWESKHWPESYWLELANIAGEHGYDVYMTWATGEQKARVERLSAQSKTITMLPHLNITEALLYLKGSNGVVSIDTGFAHLASALAIPMVSLYGPTDSRLVGSFGVYQLNLSSQIACSPCLNRVCTYTGNIPIKPACFFSLTPQLVWKKLTELMQLQ
jgi:heptosyltransferase-1